MTKVLLLFLFSTFLFSILSCNKKNNEINKSHVTEKISQPLINQEVKDLKKQNPKLIEYTVIATTLNIREEPNINSKIIKQMHYGDKVYLFDYQRKPVKIDGKEGTWAEAMINSKNQKLHTIGWLFDAHITEHFLYHLPKKSYNITQLKWVYGGCQGYTEDETEEILKFHNNAKITITYTDYDPSESQIYYRSRYEGNYKYLNNRIIIAQIKQHATLEWSEVTHRNRLINKSNLNKTVHFFLMECTLLGKVKPIIVSPDYIQKVHDTKDKEDAIWGISSDN